MCRTHPVENGRRELTLRAAWARTFAPAASPRSPVGKFITGPFALVARDRLFRAWPDTAPFSMNATERDPLCCVIEPHR